MATLDVWLYDRRAGSLVEDGGLLAFSYSDAYLRDPGPPLSLSLPPRAEPYGHAAAQSFFSNLLPEGAARAAAARWMGISERNDFGLLSALGGDCAGAVSLLPPGKAPRGPDRSGVEWLRDGDLARAIDDLPRRPLHADPDGDVRISLAGAQDKLVVVVDGERLGFPTGSTPSTHIVKAPIRSYDDTVANEAWCLRFARELGVEAATAELRSADGREFLLVERYDRLHQAGKPPVRIHQEDICQALGVPPDLKYESEGGPSLADCFAVIREGTTVPALAALALVDAVAVNFLIGNHDAHAKNFSLLHAPGDTRLAPLYDLLSTTVYGLGRKMAMKIGGEYRADYVARRHFDRLAADAQLGAAAVRRRVLALAGAAGRASEAATAALPGDVADRPVIAAAAGTVAARSEQLERELS